jgi:hypothetical protein
MERTRRRKEKNYSELMNRSSSTVPAREGISQSLPAPPLLEDEANDGEDPDDDPVHVAPLLPLARQRQPVEHVGDAEDDGRPAHAVVEPVPVPPRLGLLRRPRQQRRRLQARADQDGDADGLVCGHGATFVGVVQLEPGDDGRRAEHGPEALRGHVRVEPERVVPLEEARQRRARGDHGAPADGCEHAVPALRAQAAARGSRAGC